jgi:hypothetical protein
LESQAAVDYWGAWRDLDVVFVQRDYDRVPEHWRTFGVRRSLITRNPRKATNPANAILNYLYSILEAEARIAALTIGLDPGIGVMHADLKARDSLVCDLIEALRPTLMHTFWTSWKKRAFKRVNFFETREGVCRLLPPIANELIRTTEECAEELGPITEFVTRNLSKDAPTLLTESNRSAGRTKYHRAAQTSTENSPICTQRRKRTYVYRPWSDVELTLAHVGEGLSFYPKKYPSRTQVLKKTPCRLTKRF